MPLNLIDNLISRYIFTHCAHRVGIYENQSDICGIERRKYAVGKLAILFGTSVINHISLNDRSSYIWIHSCENFCPAIQHTPHSFVLVYNIAHIKTFIIITCIHMNIDFQFHVCHSSYSAKVGYVNNKTTNVFPYTVMHLYAAYILGVHLSAYICFFLSCNYTRSYCCVIVLPFAF